MKPLTNAERLEIRKRTARRKTAKKRRKRRQVTEACFGIECPSIHLIDRRDGKLGARAYCLRIYCPLEDQPRLL